MTKRYDIVAIGNAIVDVLATEDQGFPARHGMAHGKMDLLGFDAAAAKRAQAIYDTMGETTEVSGGSAANTLAGMAQLGSRCAFVGSISDDEKGRHFRHDLNAVGVDFDTPAKIGGLPTAQCLIIVTPDGERTMNTYLGAAGDLSESDIDEAHVKKAGIVLGEGYMWDKPSTKDAMRKAFRVAKAHGGKVAFTTSAEFCINNHREEFQSMIEKDIDILFCNDDEAKALYPDKTFEQVLDALQHHCEIAVVTLGDQGSVVLARNPKARHRIAAAPIQKLVDTTGAGDMYAAGFLYGLTQGHGLEVCGKLGSACAAQVIQQIGARVDAAQLRAACEGVLAQEQSAVRRA